MQLLFTISVAILSLAEGQETQRDPGPAKQFTDGNCTGTCHGLPGGPCKKDLPAGHPGCVGVKCGPSDNLICDPRGNAGTAPEICCPETNTCVAWNADGSNCRMEHATGLVPVCETIDALASGVDKEDPNSNAGYHQTEDLHYSQTISPGYHFCPKTETCKKFVASTDGVASCPNWDQWIFQTPTSTDNVNCDVGGTQQKCPSINWEGKSLGGIKYTAGSNPVATVQCGGPAATVDGEQFANFPSKDTDGCGGNAWFYSVTYPNTYTDRWEFCGDPSGDGSTALGWQQPVTPPPAPAGKSCADFANEVAQTVSDYCSNTYYVTCLTCGVGIMCSDPTCTNFQAACCI